MKRIAIVASHPIQYYAPWFRDLAQQNEWKIQVFYLWDFGVSCQQDKKFQAEFAWDLPLLDGYSHEWVPNTSRQAGTHRFSGLKNPSLIQRVLQWKPDAVLFTTLFFYSPLRLLLSLRKRSIPCFFRGDSHLLAHRSLISLPVDILKNLIFRQFTACLHVGSANRDYFLAHGVSPQRLFPVPHCVNNHHFETLTHEQNIWLKQQRSKLNLQDDLTVFLFAGKFENKKRPVLLAEQFHSMEQKNTRLLFVGSGHLQPHLEDLARKDPRIHILPFQNQSLMPAVYRLADCLVLPSFGPGETWGLCVNEAMASGIPALVSSHVGCWPDLVKHGKTGWIFQAEEPGLLRDMMKSIIADPHHRAEVANAAQSHIHHYSYATATAGLHQALDSIL
ncbi:MAG: glycosyltransferase family 4 protein [Verrucomicrobiota bacterium]